MSSVNESLKPTGFSRGLAHPLEIKIENIHLPPCKPWAEYGIICGVRAREVLPGKDKERAEAMSSRAKNDEFRGKWKVVSYPKGIVVANGLKYDDAVHEAWRQARLDAIGSNGEAEHQYEVEPSRRRKF